jgi:HAD superfamily hydrolase (TIGR01484 family)
VRYLALCCDYDGTLAEDGNVSNATVAALERVRASGRKLLLVTGRILEELHAVCSCVHLFDRVVAENGASVYNPSTGEERLLAERPAELFIQTLRDRGVRPLSVGRVVVAAWQPHQTIVLNTIRDLGLELQVIFNKDAFMVLPTGINKASGLAVALQDMNLSARNIVGIGDAENDHAFLGSCEVGVAVDNALALLKRAADFVTTKARGAGVVELIEELLTDDLRARESQLTRRRFILGLDDSGGEILLRVPDFNSLLVGDPGSGKSALTSSLLEHMAAQGYNFCVIDPGGQYETLEGILTVGSSEQVPTLEQVQRLLNSYNTNVVVNLAGMPRSEQANFFPTLLNQILEARWRTGRPHWVVIDNIQDLLPADSACAMPKTLPGILRIGTHPKLIAASALKGSTSVLAVGKAHQSLLDEFGLVTGLAAPQPTAFQLTENDALYWSVSPVQPPQKITLPSGRP